METFNITLNVGGIRYVDVNGRQFIVAPMTILKSQVLPGSKGALYYPVEEIKKVSEQWNGKPLVSSTHPKLNGRNVSANLPEIFQKQEIGRFYNSQVANNGDNTGEGWFDVELTKKHDSRIYNALVKGEKIEVSTGLYTEDKEAPKDSVCNGVPYSYIATDYRPDHIAILIEEKGACSVRDGCGVFNSEKKEGAEDTQTDNKQIITCAYCGTTQNKSKDLLCNKCGELIKPIPNIKDAVMNERNNIIKWLTTNCTCYKAQGSTEKLNALTDNALKEVLLENAEKGAENDGDQTFLDWISNADKDIKNAFVGMIKNKIKNAVGTSGQNAGFPPKKPADPNAPPANPAAPPAGGGQAATDPDEEMKKKQAAMAGNSMQFPTMTQEQFFQMFPFMKSLVTNGQAQENNEKQQLIGRITNHITDNSAKQQAVAALGGKSLDDLRLMASLIPQTNPIANNSVLPFSQPIAHFFGATGAPADITANEQKDLQKEQLVVNEINWSEWAKNTSVYDSAKDVA